MRKRYSFSMKEIFHKDAFPTAPGKNIHQWEEADTTFEIAEDGYYVVAITASARNAAEKKSTDDDDLRAAIDDYEFGKHEAHQAKISWRGFGTAASWDGASLKGGTKAVYFFVALEEGKHSIRFWADEKPTIHEITVSQIEEDKGAIEDVIFKFGEKASGTPTDTKGIPWKAFVFTGDFNTTNLAVKLVDIQAQCQGAKQKRATDGDNIRAYVNGQIVHNPKAPTSDKYKNFFFSGDLSQGETEALMIDGKVLLWAEQDMSIELWYDATPTLERIKIELSGKSSYDRKILRQRWLGYVEEAKRWPRNLWDNFMQIREINGLAIDAALQYADENGFVITDSEGRMIRQWEDNEVDALRHFTWNVLLTRKFDDNVANIITANHEIFWMEASNKQELSRSGIFDMWNNLQGRKYALQYPNKEHLELFVLAKSEGNVLLNLESVTDEHSKEAQDIVTEMRNGA